MDERLNSMAKEYSVGRDSSESLDAAVERLYRDSIRLREGALLESAAAAVALERWLMSDDIDYSRITPQMQEAWGSAYPNVDLESLISRSPNEVAGFVNGWKGKYFEVLVRDRLNAGEWVGDVHLEPGQTAELAKSAIQRGWDLNILDPDGTTNELLQLKATDSLRYVKSALEEYPDIDIIATDDVFDGSDFLLEKIHPSGLSDSELENAIGAPLEELLDSPLEEVLETILPGLPFLLIAVGEGRKVLIGRKSYNHAFYSGVERGIKSAASMGVGYLVWLADGGFISIPATIMTRLGIDRLKILRMIERELMGRINLLEQTAGSYSTERE